MLLVFPIVLYFLQRIIQPTGRLRAQIDSYMALGRVLALYRQGKMGKDVSLEFGNAISSHADLYAAAYPESEFRPKNHFLHHVAMDLHRNGLIIDCFVGERRHGLIKKCASDVANTRRFEKPTLCKVLCC